jgi:hypothetical protein
MKNQTPRNRSAGALAGCRAGAPPALLTIPA